MSQFVIKQASHTAVTYVCFVEYCSSTLTKTERGFLPAVEHIGVPQVVMAEKGNDI